MKRSFVCLPPPFICWLLLLCFFTSSAAGPTHPLDPLSAEEISSAVNILRASPGFPKAAMFSTVVLNEPPKEEVINYKEQTKFRREAFAIVYDRIKNKTYEAVVDLSAGRRLSWKEIPGAQPLVFVDEYEVVPGIVKADPRWQASMRKRGITDFDKVQIDTWAVGQVGDNFKGRLLRALSYYKEKQINFYGRPIEGVVALVDMNARKVLEVIDTATLPLPPPSQELDTAANQSKREKLKPLVISQPAGASYQLNGNEIRWQKWRFRFSMHPREGLVLYTVGYEDGDSVRPILYRAALSEMVVPYGDPSVTWRWRSAFDVGEYGVGRLASPLEPRLDAPENAQLLDATFADDNGKPYTKERAVGIYERDGGILWKHYDDYSERNETRRARELVLFFIATIGNYDYAVNYIFKEDASMEVDLALTGIMLPKGVREKRMDENHMMTGMAMPEHLVAENVAAPHHQHFFNFRLDFDVDGVQNTVTEMNTSAMPAGPNNPYGNGFVMSNTPFQTEVQACRNMDLQAARSWGIVNPDRKNRLGQHTSYLLLPGANTLPYIARASATRKRAGFINNHFWATRYNASEIYAAGVYPNQSKGGDGLPQYIANNERIDNTDVVVWYTLGITHIPRPEEWPVMPATHIGFRIVPGSFFSANPGMDVQK